MQKAIIIYFLTGKKNNIDELNQLLSEGWKVISQKPMSNGQGNASLSLVIVEK
ncbi:hypothetical protein ACTHPH_14545 [Paenibacillus pasadenensis]|uniref:hypothetical protein n=1 Tax=Paenibacillus pasadenensis TaxID=217090 RepID=UPI00040F3264|nr:hypothetical protein [Paenibacillus pasadenensis]